MQLHSWLNRLYRQFAGVSHHSGCYRKRRRITAASAIVELLETRQVLTSGAAAVGFETLVNSYTPGSQFAVSVAMDETGDYVSVWASNGQDGSGVGIYAQRYNATGTVQGGEFRVNTYTTGTQNFPAVAMDATGDFVITWQSNGQDGSSYGIYGQRYNAAGVAQGAEFKVNTYTTLTQNSPAVAMDATGDFVITWQSNGQDGSSYGIYGQRYNAAGVAQGAEFKVNTYTTSSQVAPAVAIDAAGDFVVVWQSNGQDGSGYGIYAKRYNAAGAAQGGEFKVNTYTTNSQTLPAIASDATGDFVITWQSNVQDGSGWGIYAQRYNSVGAIQGVEFRVNTYTTNGQVAPAVAMDAAKDFVITWQSNVQDGSSWGIYAQRYDSVGTPQAGEFRGNTYRTASQTIPAVAMDKDGDFVIAWQSNLQDGSSYGIYTQRYAATVGPIVTAVLEGTGPRVVHDGDKLTSSITAMSVNFSDDLNVAPEGANSVTNPSNWRLTQNGIDLSYLITDISFGFHVSTNRYVAIVSFATPLTTGSFQLRARQTIRDLTGRSLDGEADGVSGGDFRRSFLVAKTLAAGSESRVNTTTASFQYSAKVAMDTAGNYVVAWSSFLQDGSANGIYAQRYNAAGTPQGVEFRVNNFTTGAQHSCSVAMDETGDFVITWTSSGQDGSGDGIYAQRYTAPGTPQGAEFRVNTYTTNDQTEPSVAMDAKGDFVITWQSAGQDGSSDGIYAQRYNAAGTPQGAEFKVSSYTLDAQQTPVVAMDETGDFVIAWQSFGQDGNGWGIYAKRYNAVGTPQGAEFRVNTYTTSSQHMPAVAMDETGDFVIAWASVGQDGSGYGVYGQRYNAAGNPQGAEFRINTYTTQGQSSPTVAADAEGDFVIAWESDGQDSSNTGVYTQRYQADIAPWLYQIEGTPLQTTASLSTPVTSSLLTVDYDSSHLTGATVQISINYRSNQDVLAFANTVNITGSWNATTGILTLSGKDTVANYRTALRSVTYHNSSATPNTSLTRTVDLHVTDGLLLSNTVSRDVSVKTSIPAAKFSLVSGAKVFTENPAQQGFGANLTVDCPHNASLATATDSASITRMLSDSRIGCDNAVALPQIDASLKDLDETRTLTMFIVRTKVKKLMETLWRNAGSR